jgi:hypothetical protein
MRGFFKYDNEYNSTEEGINKHFMYMAVVFRTYYYKDLF